LEQFFKKCQSYVNTALGRKQLIAAVIKEVVFVKTV
jgi:hypothetical protein